MGKVRLRDSVDSRNLANVFSCISVYQVISSFHSPHLFGLSRIKCLNLIPCLCNFLRDLGMTSLAVMAFENPRSAIPMLTGYTCRKLGDKEWMVGSANVRPH